MPNLRITITTRTLFTHTSPHRGTHQTRPCSDAKNICTQRFKLCQATQQQGLLLRTAAKTLAAVRSNASRRQHRTLLSHQSVTRRRCRQALERTVLLPVCSHTFLCRIPYSTMVIGKPYMDRRQKLIIYRGSPHAHAHHVSVSTFVSYPAQIMTDRQNDHITSALLVEETNCER